MQRSETAGQVRGQDLGLDLRPPVRLDPWALLLAVGIVAGTVAPPLGVALFLASLVVCAGVAIHKDLISDEWRAMALLGPLFVAGGVGVAFLHATAFDPLLEFAAIEPGEVVVVGSVVSPPVPTKVGQRADVRIEHLWYEEKEVLRGGGIQVYANDMRAGVGDRVQLNGDLERPETKEDGFDYSRYLQTRGISGVVYAKGVWPVDEERGWVGEVHRRTDATLGNGLRPREQAVVRGMVLGDSSRLPEEVEEAFQRSGITHVLAISGQHVAVLAAMIFVVLRLFAVPMLFRNPATLGLMWLYIFIAGAPPSALRAGVVATFVLAAPLFGRQLSPLHFMTTMLAAVLAWNPLLVYSPGFQLSVAAVFGILLLRKPLKAFLERTLLRPFSKPPEILSNLLSVSLAAQIATAPIIATSFDEVSVIGVLTNLIAVPLSGPILTLGPPAP
ncbi:MAG: ComEC family competence protein, partial [Actinomycetota bacterium]|nr:ComEC family competence protein [Actinomycetota bacterium]